MLRVLPGQLAADQALTALLTIRATPFDEAAEETGPVVLLVEDLDDVDERERPLLAQLATAVRPIAILAIAREDGWAGDLSPPFELRRRRPLDAVETLRFLVAGDRPVTPHVAGRLATACRGNPAVLAETARLLSDDQLAGGAILPNPLPAGSSVRRLHSSALADHDPSERATILLAAISVTGGTEALLQATGMTLDSLLGSTMGEHLDFVSGRYSFRDPRLRGLVHHDASVTERTKAHAELAAAHARRGEEDARL